MSCIEKGDYVGSLFIDVCKASDVRVDHVTLMKKLALYKLRVTSLKWFKSYGERKQAVGNWQGHSEFKQVKSGVPQGSTFFLLFINNLPTFSLNFVFVTFMQMIQHFTVIVTILRL